MATITAVAVQKRRPDRVSVDLDGEFAFSLSGLLAAGLKVGAQLSAQQITSLQARDADEAAYQRALRLLSLRDRSEAELRTHLRKHRTPEDVLDRTLARLREHRHADDAKFARTWIENRTTFRPRGRRALAWELRQKGIPADIAETALSGVDEAALAHQAGLKKASQLDAADWHVFRTKVAAYLARRGFPSSIIASTISDLWTEMHAGQPSLQTEEIP